jgi:type I restriction enzyme S subunit
MPENWKTYKLTDLGTIARGKSKHRPRDASHLYGGKFPFIQTGDVKAANHRLNKHTQTYSVAGLAQSKLWPENTMCITIAANIAETAILSYPACFPDSIIGFVADEDKCDIEFVEYLMQFFKKQIQTHSIGSVQDNINLGTFQRVEFTVPPLEEQKSIASILSALDDKIELNLRMNKTLEEMAMALYKHWFVDFGPFQEGEFVDSELGEIPKEWEVKSINAFGQVVCGKTPSKKDPDNFTHIGGYPFIKIPEMHGNVFLTETLEKISEKGNQTQAKKLLPSGCINVSCIATVGLVTINAFPSHTNQQINSIIPEKTNYRYYLYSTMISLKERFLNEASGGSATLNMNTSTFSKIEILKPDEETLQQFSEMTTSIFSKILQNQEENQTLTQLRDTLLPKLISGEVRVKDAEKTLSEVL